MAPLNGVVYTVDLMKVAPQHPSRHRTIQKDVMNLSAADLDGRHVDLVFFDAHMVEPQMHMCGGRRLALNPLGGLIVNSWLRLSTPLWRSRCH